MGESKTTETVVSVLVDRMERESATNLGGDLELENKPSNPIQKGANHTLTVEYLSTQPEEVTQQTSHFI